MPQRKGQKREVRKVNPLAYQGDILKDGVNCSHGVCKRVRIIATQVILRDAKDLGFSVQQAKRAVAHLPKLLCGAGEWPPPELPAKTVAFIFAAFVIGCLQANATNLRGQQLRAYDKAAETIKARGYETVPEPEEE